MSQVIYDMSMSLDGCVIAAGATPEEPLGIGGEHLHEWGIADSDPRNTELLERTTERLGALLTGRGNYEASLPWWGPDGPTGEVRMPLFVVTHRGCPPPPEGSVYTFVTDGIDSAVSQAKAAAGDKDVAVSGVDVARQLLLAGHLDELWIHVVPVLFGDGTRLFEHVGGEHVRLELIEAVATRGATHLHYRVLTD